MKGLLSFLLFAVLGGGGWFYQAKYAPLVQSASNQAANIDALNTQLAEATTQIDSLNRQIKSLSSVKAADETEMARLKAQLDASKRAAPDNTSDSAKTFVQSDMPSAKPNWTWSVLGRDYHNVVVTKVEADCVHVSYDGGVGTMNMSDLPPDLRKMFNYDPALAAQAAREKAAAAAKIDAEQAPLIAAEQQKEQAQAAADEALRLKNLQEQNAAIAAGGAQDQIQNIRRDMDDMVAHHEVTVSTDPKTGAVTYGGTTYWLNKYYADQAALAQLSPTANSAGR